MGYVAPRTELESFLADKWLEMLGIDRIGVHDNFFELGVNSIKAAVFLNNLQKEMGEAVYIVTLFDSPTIAELAVLFERCCPEPRTVTDYDTTNGISHCQRADDVSVRCLR